MMRRRFSGYRYGIVLFLGLSVTACDAAGSAAVDLVTPSFNPTATTVAPLVATETPEAAPTSTQTPIPQTFDGSQALSYVEAQMAFGPRWPGSRGHEAVGDYIVGELQASDWDVEQQVFEYRGIQGRNIIGRANQDKEGVIIIGAHYDTRRIADQTPGAAAEEIPVPGAVDGASGVAVLLELAHAMDLQRIPHAVWLAFFDLEDNGGGAMDNWDWIVGSRHMAQNLTVRPQAVVVVDMVGDADQQLYYEGNSDPGLQQDLWQVAGDLGFDEAFVPQLRHTMIDDHLPFRQRNLPAALIIDFDYPYWHTVEDTVDKVSLESLFRVGRTVEVWLEERLDE